MASRHLLQCPELLAEIFSHLQLSSTPSDVEDTHTQMEIDRKQQHLRKTLAAAALSCRALTGHALAVLWRRLDSMQPLLSLLSKPKRQFPKTNITVSQPSALQRQRLTLCRCCGQISPSSPGCASRLTGDGFEPCMTGTGSGFIPRHGLSLGDGVARSRSYLIWRNFRYFLSVFKTPRR